MRNNSFDSGFNGSFSGLLPGVSLGKHLDDGRIATKFADGVPKLVLLEKVAGAACLLR